MSTGKFPILNTEDSPLVANPHISPIDAMIAPDLSRLRVPATETIAVAMVEEARARRRDKDQRGRIKRSVCWHHNVKSSVTY